MTVGRCVAALTALAVAVLLGHAGVRLLGRNFDVVIPGEFYRCAQPAPADLRAFTARHGVRTVLNLRGCCYPFDWYREESRTTAELDLNQEDVTLSAGRLPAPSELRRLIEVLHHAERPVLIHCRRGIDRTGLAAAAVRLLFTGATVAEARGELSLWYGHLAVGRTAAMLRFFDLYETWLAGRPHSPERFRQWAMTEYRPGPCSGRLELAGPPELSAGRPGSLRLRATNSSAENWELKPGPRTGICARYFVHDAAGRQLQTGHVFLFRATVPPGGAVETDLPIDALEPGYYTVSADLLDRIDTFTQLGNDPFAVTVSVE